MAELKLNNVIVHELIKEAKKDFDHSKIYNLRTSCLSVEDPLVIKLVTDISALYGTKGNQAHYGTFKTELTEQGPIPGIFDNYTLVTDDIEVKFMAFSVAVMKELYKKARGKNFASGGFLVFGDYEINKSRYFLIAMIKQKPGLAISDKLEPLELMQLDLSKINQAARISFNRFNEYKLADDADKTEFSYLSFISKGSNQTTSGYFITALGCDKGIASSKATNKLPSESRKFFNSHAELKNSALLFHKDVVSYLNKQLESNTSAKLSDLESIASKYMTYLDEEKREQLISDFAAHMNSEDVRIPIEFMVSSSALKKLKNLQFRTKELSFDFDKSLLGNTKDAYVCYDESTGILSFTNLPEDKKLEIKLALEETMKIKEAGSKEK
ncbi:nucleoid-associated protein [Erwinia billingiae]|uniref:nucleoid-associated protein n=1 Tax=Erwinia billingiae TaxID=182337 RepID=UPI0022473977|nr:nucleoid-associated protein [Erwinia billingiae]MCX0499717.1 nucleoid-associated protein [Erwinia billingiae]